MQTESLQTTIHYLRIADLLRSEPRLPGYENMTKAREPAALQRMPMRAGDDGEEQV
jgi:hypothetical protein